MPTHFDHDYDQIMADLDAGLMTQDEAKRALRHLRAEHREDARDAAEEAYRRIMDDG